MNKMAVLLTALIDSAKKHGLAFLVMLGLVLYFHAQNERLEKKFDVCNSKVIEIYQSNNTQLINALERNTIALEKVAEKK